jgi:glycosyltransferase involved in cell wall biosynthesis
VFSDADQFPLVSLVVITKNPNLEWLTQTFKSIACQIYKNIEVVIVDASDDSISLAIKVLANDLLSTEVKFQWYRQSSVGLWAAFSEGFRNSNGEILSVINSDDYLADDLAIQVVIEKIVATKADYIYANSRRIYANGDFAYIHKPPLPLTKFSIDYYVFVVSHHTLYFKRDILNKIPFGSESLSGCVDLIFIRNLIKSNFHGEYLNRSVACFRLHEHNFSASEGLLVSKRLFTIWTGLPGIFFYISKLIVTIQNPGYLRYLISRWRRQNVEKV